MPQSIRTLHELAKLLNISELLHVVDIGANPIGPPPPYAPLLAAGLIRLTGFEPQKDAFDALLSGNSTNRNYFPLAVGDGLKHTLHIYRASGLTSLLRLRQRTMDVFRLLKRAGRLISTEPVETAKLDSIKELNDIDFLKIDIQGGELDVFRNGTEKLKSVLAIQTEVAFFPLYDGQPMFGDVDVFLRSIGFKFHCFAHVSHFPLGRLVSRGKWRRPMRQALDGDVVYVRDFSNPDSLSDNDLAKLALLSHACFDSFDLAAVFISHLQKRGIIAEGSVKLYADLLPDEYTLG